MHLNKNAIWKHELYIPTLDKFPTAQLNQPNQVYSGKQETNLEPE